MRSTPAEDQRALLRGYCAGLFDGEGCIALRKTGALVVQMEMSQEEPVRLMRARYGGCITVRKREGKQCSWAWYANSKVAAHALSDLGPLLIAKRADLACVLPLIPLLLDRAPHTAYTPHERAALQRATQRLKRLRARRKRNGRQ